MSRELRPDVVLMDIRTPHVDGAPSPVPRPPPWSGRKTRAKGAFGTLGISTQKIPTP